MGLWFLPLLLPSAAIHTPLVRWPLDGPMVVSSQESTMVMVSYQDMEPLATEQSTLAIMDSIILESVRPRLNHTPLAKFMPVFQLTTPMLPDTPIMLDTSAA